MCQSVSIFFVHSTVPILYLHSFPTRRSSDLAHAARAAGAARRGHLPDPSRYRGDRPRGVPAHRGPWRGGMDARDRSDRKSTRLNSSHTVISYAVFCLNKKNSQISDLIRISKL